MESKIKSSLILSIALCFGMCVDSNLKIVNAGSNGESTPTIKYDSEYSITYYDNIVGLKGDSLLEGLASISLENHKYYTTYENLKGGLAYSDEDPNDSTKVIDFYTGWSMNNTWSPSASSSDYFNPWNREHVWAKSYLMILLLNQVQVLIFIILELIIQELIVLEIMDCLPI